MGRPGSCPAGPSRESGGWLETGSILLRRSLQKFYGIYDTLFCGLLQKFWKQHRENVQKPNTGDGRVCVQSLICALRMQSLTIMPGPLPGGWGRQQPVMWGSRQGRSPPSPRSTWTSHHCPTPSPGPQNAEIPETGQGQQVSGSQERPVGGVTSHELTLQEFPKEDWWARVI